jgi:hypothetical protein
MGWVVAEVPAGSGAHVGVVYAVAGVWRLLLLDATPRYWTAFFPSMVLTGLGVALCIPQLSSAIAQSLPPNRSDLGSLNAQLRLPELSRWAGCWR